MRKIYILLIILSSGCATQLPPSGGDEDKTPPQVKLIRPKPNSVNVRGNSILLKFDEYIEKRSFQNAFSILPVIQGMEFKWQDDAVEITFPSPLEVMFPSKTVIINISTLMKDMHGNNITEPVRYAFSTGTQLDIGEIKGRIYAKNNERIRVLVYNTKRYNPLNMPPDYFTEPTQDGRYSLTNLSEGTYRLLAVDDMDNNLLYTKDRENYSVLPYDIEIGDSSCFEDVNFLMTDFKIPELAPIRDTSVYYPDSLYLIYCSVENNSKFVLPDQNILFYFNKYIPDRKFLTENFSVTDEYGSSTKIVYNWINDSLLEIFPQTTFTEGNRYDISFKFAIFNDSLYQYRLSFRVASSYMFGELKGYINSDFAAYPVIIEIYTMKGRTTVRYRLAFSEDKYIFPRVLESSYNLYAFVDINYNMKYDHGYPYPWQGSEPFYIYPKTIDIRGGWITENLGITFKNHGK